MFPMYYDSSMIILIPVLIFTFYAQFKVKSTYSKYAEVAAASRITGAQVARRLLDEAHLQDIPVEITPGELSDHYDPRKKVLRLSEAIYHGNSLAALGIAAHETGHAIQHAHSYFPLVFRNALFPLANIGSRFGFFIFIIGLLFNSESSLFIVNLGILLFAFSVLFSLITLPVEFNASSRAMELLSAGGILREGEETRGARKVLSAAAMTYVAAAAMSIAQLLRMFLLRGRNND